MSKTNTLTRSLTPYAQLKENVADLTLKNDLLLAENVEFGKQNEDLEFRLGQTQAALTLSIATTRGRRVRIELYDAALEGAQKKINVMTEVINNVQRQSTIDALEAQAQQIRTQERHAALIKTIQALGGEAASA